MNLQLANVIAISSVISMAPAITQSGEEESPPESATTIAACVAEAEADYEISTEEACVGRVAMVCEAEFPNALAIPGECWERELAEWETLMENALAEVLAESQASGVEEAPALLRQSQRDWLALRESDCIVAVMSSPRTYDSIGPGCEANMTGRRALALRELRGADWSSP